jgi:molybdopterin-containing oxidoreductase family iron-sulfur binding subunit
MVIDLKRCIGCYSCQTACRQNNFTPRGVFWLKVLKSEYGKYPRVLRESLPFSCMQCRDPPCEKVCPTKATERDELTGIVIIHPDLCIGCKYCTVACPYGARTFVEKWKNYFPGQPLTPYEKYAREQWIEKRGEGKNTKCDFCAERVKNGLNPACVDLCPTKARYFGDLDDPESEVSRLIKTRRGFQLLPEYGTDPSVYYLPRR